MLVKPIPKTALSGIALMAVVSLLTLGAAMTVSVNAQGKKVTTKTTTVQKTRLTGTYRLNPAIGDNVQDLAQRATQNLPEGQRQAAFDDLLTSLEPAEMLAIERRGTTINLISSHAPRISFVANGVTRTEQTADGSTVRVRSVLGAMISPCRLI